MALIKSIWIRLFYILLMLLSAQVLVTPQEIIALNTYKWFQYFGIDTPPIWIHSAMFYFIVWIINIFINSRCIFFLIKPKDYKEEKEL